MWQYTKKVGFYFVLFNEKVFEFKLSYCFQQQDLLISEAYFVKKPSKTPKSDACFVSRLEEMSTVSRAHVQERDDVSSRLETCQENISIMTGKTGSLESQYRFFQEMRGYVTDLVECLNEKVGD